MISVSTENFLEVRLSNAFRYADLIDDESQQRVEVYPSCQFVAELDREQVSHCPHLLVHESYV